jgi:ribosomal protein L16 Arg81 hydroxylase
MPPINFGIDREKFFKHHYDKLWLMRRRAFHASDFSWRDLDNALYSWEPRSRQIRLFKGGAVPSEVFTETYMELSDSRTRIIKDVLYRYLQDGATLVLNKLQLHSPRIHDYCMTIAQFVGEKANANAYAAFGGDGSFGRHWDTHDVFVLQLIGRKHWRIYSPTFKQPQAHQSSKDHKASCPQAPVLDTVLEAGDLLYIPRGWWHEALPIESEPTFHIAVGTYPLRVIDYLIWLCCSQLPEHLEGRQPLNPYLDSNPPVEAVAERLYCLLRDPEILQAFFQSIDEKERIHSRFCISSLAEKDEQEFLQEDEQGSFRLNRFTPTANAHGLIANGFKLNLDEPGKKLLNYLSAENSTDGKLAHRSYTREQRQLLRHLREHDVVEWVERSGDPEKASTFS